MPTAKLFLQGSGMRASRGAPSEKENPSRSSWIRLMWDTDTEAEVDQTADYRGIRDAVREVSEGFVRLIEVMARHVAAAVLSLACHAGDGGGAQQGPRPDST